jgi:hypothetical protein
MTTIGVVCERWPIQIEEPKPGDDPWFADWCVGQPAQKSLSMTGGFHSYQKVKYETFGGVGAQSLMIQDFFHPDIHIVGEYTQIAVDHLKRNLKGVDIRLADAFKTSFPKHVDLMALDFGDLTVWKTREGQPHRDLIDRAFATYPKALLMTDVANQRMHLHRQRYESLLGTGATEDYPTYIHAMDEYMFSLYGYRLLSGFWHRTASKLTFVPAPEVPLIGREIGPTPTSPVGLELL